MDTIAGQSFTEMKNKILSEITAYTDIMKALVMHSENFLNVNPTVDELSKINNAEKQLIRKQIFPYKNISLTSLDAETYITTGFYNFKKQNKNYIYGSITFFIIVANTLEKTKYGSRYDFIADKLEELFCNTGIGEFEFKSRSDVDLPNAEFLCHSITFDIVDFHWVGE